MAFNFLYTRCSAIAQILLGFLLVVFGIADRVTMFYDAFQTVAVPPIWIGVWVVITGVIGFLGSRRTHVDQNNRPSKAMIGTYLGFSIVSVVFAAALIILYVAGVVDIFSATNGCTYWYYYYYQHHGTDVQLIMENYQCKTSVALGSMVIIFAILEFGFGIMASICSCMNGCCCCCDPSAPQMQAIYPPSNDYAMDAGAGYSQPTRFQGTQRNNMPPGWQA